MPSSPERGRLRALIDSFLQQRLETKVEKLSLDDPKYAELTAQFQRDAWLADAARRVGQLQVVTHSLKPIHPDAKGTNLYVSPTSLKNDGLVSSHVLGEDFYGDVVGNAAALDVYKFLRLELDGKSLLERVLDDDAELAMALSDNAEQAAEWMQAFAAITRPRGGESSHTRAKQLYWLVGDDPTEDQDYHLLAPLYATSLAHRVFQTINDDRFSEATKLARQARRDGKFSQQGYRDYPELAVQKMGGTKPQNISQLNSERGGNNYLLASLPPRWVSRDITPPLFMDSVFFTRFGKQQNVRRMVRGLIKLLKADPARNMSTRERRDQYLGALIDELVLFTSAYSVLEPGWSASPDCRLVDSEALWLDPYRDETDFAARRQQGDWAQQIRQRFASWLNKHMERSKLAVGDPEHTFWVSQLRKQLDALQEALPHVQ